MQTLRSGRIRFCKHREVTLKVYQDIFKHERCHVDNFEVKQDLPFFAVQGIPHVDLKKVRYASDKS